MTLDWDPTKSEENFVRRGFDFVFASMMFNASHVEYDDTRRDYGERRIVALGRADSIPLTVVFTDRIAPDGAIVRRIISARLKPKGTPPLCPKHQSRPNERSRPRVALISPVYGE